MAIDLSFISPETQHWLLDPTDPGPRYLALLRLGSDQHPDFAKAQLDAHRMGPISVVLQAMHPDGFWEIAGPGYLPKYRSTVWSLILLAQLGAKIGLDDRIARACSYYLDHALSSGGQISSNGAPSGTVDCLQGNILAALLELGFSDDRLQSAFEWMARTTTGEGIAPQTEKKASLRYYAGKSGPDFNCGANNKLACAWGGVKVLLAFSKLPSDQRTPLIDRAIQRGVDFLFSVDPVDAAYPTGWNDKPSRNWWKFGFPVFYVTDILQLCEVLGALGHGGDPRLQHALGLVREKATAEGKWLLEYDYGGKTWLDFGPKNKPNKWVTIRALAVLQQQSMPDGLDGN